jgi:uncharacterized membrane protein
MLTPASIQKHPIHPMLVAFPIGLWIFSFVVDIIHIIGWGDPNVWASAAFYGIAGGIIGAVLAAVPGFLDFLSLAGKPKTIAFWHMIVNVIALVLFAVSFALRFDRVSVLPAPFILSAVGVALIGLSGWLGGELVYVHEVAVDHEGRHPAR